MILASLQSQLWLYLTVVLKNVKNCDTNCDRTLHISMSTHTICMLCQVSMLIAVGLFSRFFFWQGIGNGIPLGAVVTTPEIAKALTHRNYFNTFGGNPVCTAAGLAVLKVIEKEKLQDNAFVVGSHLKERLNALKDKYESKVSS